MPFLSSDRSEAIREALEFLHAATLATPLHSYASRFEPCHAPVGLGEIVVEALEAFESDLARWSLLYQTPGELFPHLTLAPHLEAIFLYRLCRTLFQRKVEELPGILATLSRQLSGMEIYHSAEIGPGLKIIHGLGTVIGAHCRIGSEFTVYHGVTVGDRLGSRTGVRPVIGDRVIASAGAQVLGPVTVGSESVIGAGAVVIDSLPERCVAVGAPARVVSRLDDDAFAEFWRSIKG